MPTSPKFDMDHLKLDVLKTDSKETFSTPRHLPAGAARGKYKYMIKRLSLVEAYVQSVESSDEGKIAHNMASMICDGYGQLALDKMSFLEYGMGKQLITTPEFEMLSGLRTPALVKQLFDGTIIRRDELFAELAREIDFVIKLVGTTRLVQLSAAIYPDKRTVREGALHRSFWVNRLERLLVVSDMAWRRSYDPLSYPVSPTARVTESLAPDDLTSPFDEHPDAHVAKSGSLASKPFSTPSPAEGASGSSLLDAEGGKVKFDSSADFGGDRKIAPKGAVSFPPGLMKAGVPPTTPLSSVAPTPSKLLPAAMGASLPTTSDLDGKLSSAFNHMRDELEESMREKMSEVGSAIGKISDLCSPELIKRYVSEEIGKTSPASSGKVRIDADDLHSLAAALRGSEDTVVSRISPHPPHEPLFSASLVKGVSHAGSPDVAAAWAKRPKPGLSAAQEKAALRRLKDQYSPSSLLDLAPPPGRNDLFVECRSAILEGAYMYKHVLSSAADTDADLLSSLLACARSRMVGLEGHRWKPIVRATTVLDFFSQLDQLYMNAADNTCELEWADAEKRAKTVLDLFRRLRPLLKDVASCQRAKESLKARLAKLGPVAVSGMQALVQCPDDPSSLSQWEAALAFADNAISLVLEAQADKEKLSGAQRRDGINSLENDGDGGGTRSLNPLVNGQPAPRPAPFSAVLDTVNQLSEQEQTACANMVLSMRAKAQGVPPLPTYGALTLGGAGLDAVTPQEADFIQNYLRERRAAVSVDHNAVDSSTESSLHNTIVNAQMQALAALQNGAFKPIYDLIRVYPFCGISVDEVPEAKSGAGAGAGKCKICELLGVTILEYGRDVQTPLAKNTRFDHNPWKCGCIPRAVQKAAADKGASEEEVRSILTPLPRPPWKA